MAIGILLSNFVPSTGPSLQQSTFVGVSVPIAVGLLVMMFVILNVPTTRLFNVITLDTSLSYRRQVPYIVQSQV